MQLKNLFRKRRLQSRITEAEPSDSKLFINSISKVTAIAIVASNALYAENYVSVEFLQYNENSNRVSVSAPSLSASYDIGTDFNIKVDFVSDAVSGATPAWQSDSASGASNRVKSGDYVYENQAFEEFRAAGSFMLTTRFDNRDELYTGFDSSVESDFESKSVSAEYMHYTDKSHNQSINVGASYTLNGILSFANGNNGNNRRKDDEHDTGSGASQQEQSNSFNIQAGVSQVINDHAVVKVEAFGILDNGYLTNPHANVVRDYNRVSQRLVTESRPDKRTAYGVSLKEVSMLGDNVSLKNSYRFYTDDWDISSHTLESDAYYTLNKKLTLGAGVRYYSQTAANFYNKSKDFFTNEQYASSDERLSQFNALTYKASVDFKYSDDISYNLGGQFYSQSTGLDATMITTGLKYKF